MPIFEHIHAFELIYLANHSGLFEKAEAAFRRIFSAGETGGNNAWM